MNRLLVLTDVASTAEAIRLQLAPSLDLTFVTTSHLFDTTPHENLLIDIGLRNDSVFFRVEAWLRHRSKSHRLVVMVNKGSMIDSVRAEELGPTDVLARPVEQAAILTALLGDFDSLILDRTNPPIRTCPAVAPALDALANIFASSRLGAVLDLPVISDAANTVSEHINSRGLEAWLDTVRRHHSQTYQHSLVVMGITAAFCRRLGFPLDDQRRITLGAMFHDLGKVHVPVSILEKPAALDQSEIAIMQRHPELGFELLKSSPGIHEEIFDMVLHHHEFLDGSGYPHQLLSRDISDSVRIMTICDVFGALIERRSYKEPKSGEAAFKTLMEMGSKLDKDLLREFRGITEFSIAA